MVVVWLVLFIVLMIILFGVYQKLSNAVCVSSVRLDGKTALVTGGTAGMGLEVATELARRGARVLVASPFEQEGRAALRHIAHASRSRELQYRRLDLASLAATRRFAADLLRHEPRLDILVNNAGVAPSSMEKTEDEMNFVMQVNYFGTFLLTNLLLPLLKKTGKPRESSRIVNTASVLHRLGKIDVNDLNADYKYLKGEVYARSKLCVALFTKELKKRLEGDNVVVNCVDPGAVGTGIFEKWNGVLGWILKWVFLIFFKTPRQGAQTAIHVALDESVEDIRGEYFENCRKSKAAPTVYDEELAKALWTESERIVGL